MRLVIRPGKPEGSRPFFAIYDDTGAVCSGTVRLLGIPALVAMFLRGAAGHKDDEVMGLKRGTGPMYLKVRALIEASPLPWTWGMIRDWMGWSDGHASIYLVYLVTSGYIWRIEKGLYGPISQRPRQRLRTVPPPRVTVMPASVITDEVLKRYGFNL